MKYIKNLIIKFNKYTSTFNNGLYFRIWNLIFIIINKPIRLTSEGDGNIILVSDNEDKIFISQKLRTWFYFKSINNRLDSLGRMYFLDRISFSENDTIIDCGANIGEIYKSIKLFNNKSFFYYGFEPVQSEFEIVQRNTINQISRPIALFDKNEYKKIYLHIAGADSTLLQDDRYHEGNLVECIRLDSLSNLHSKKIKLLKLEAEGAELQVLHGCGDILQNIEFISADIGFELEQGTKSNEVEVSEYLIENNFYKVASNSRHVNLFKNKNF
jgi:FkbM family methyltransferase